MNSVFTLTCVALAALTFATAATFAEDAMAPAPMASDAMAPDAMAPMMSDDDLAVCLEQAGAITFPSVMQAATHACHGGHNGPSNDATATDAMAPAAMASDSMAPAQ